VSCLPHASTLARPWLCPAARKLSREGARRSRLLSATLPGRWLFLLDHGLLNVVDQINVCAVDRARSIGTASLSATCARRRRPSEAGARGATRTSESDTACFSPTWTAPSIRTHAYSYRMLYYYPSRRPEHAAVAFLLVAGAPRQEMLMLQQLFNVD
jgi:hypothetical protein